MVVLEGHPSNGRQHVHRKIDGVQDHPSRLYNIAAFNIGGERKVLDGGSEPQYVALYEIDSSDVLLSKEWAEAAAILILAFCCKSQGGSFPIMITQNRGNRPHRVS